MASFASALSSPFRNTFQYLVRPENFGQVLSRLKVPLVDFAAMVSPRTTSHLLVNPLG